MAKYLDQTGLTQLWLKIRAYIDAKAGVPDGSVTTAKLADKAVTTAKVADLSAMRGEMGLGNTRSALPIANGGTGATTADGARRNLFNYPSNDELLKYLGLK